MAICQPTARNHIFTLFKLDMGPRDVVIDMLRVQIVKVFMEHINFYPIFGAVLHHIKTPTSS